MKTKITITAILIAIVAASSASAVELSDRDYRVLSESQDEELTLFEVEGPAGNRFTVGRSQEEFTARELDSLTRMRETFYGFDVIDIDELKVIFYDDRIEALLVPAEIPVNGEDLSGYVPSGMQFYLQEALRFDFRMVVGDYFVRQRGEFFSEDQLLERMQEAIANPVAYIQSTDPRYLFERLEVLQTAIDELGEEYDALNEDHTQLAERHQDLQGRHRDLSESHEELQGDYEELLARHEELSARHADLQEAHTALEEKHEELGTRHASLREDFDIARYGTLILNNLGWFGRVDLPDPDMVSEVVALKEDQPSISVEEATSRMQEQFPDSDVEEDEIFLVFVMYFNETE